VRVISEKARSEIELLGQCMTILASGNLNAPANPVAARVASGELLHAVDHDSNGGGKGNLEWRLGAFGLQLMALIDMARALEKVASPSVIPTLSLNEFLALPVDLVRSQSEAVILEIMSKTSGPQTLCMDMTRLEKLPLGACRKYLKDCLTLDDFLALPPLHAEKFRKLTAGLASANAPAVANVTPAKT
jgi:hypothetical protein